MLRVSATAVLFVILGLNSAVAYPPAVGILGNAESCLTCHQNNGPWVEDEDLIIDIIDASTGESFMTADGSFELVVDRNTQETVRTIIGYQSEEGGAAPYRNAWLYVAEETIGDSSLSKFLPGWDVNLPMACRIVGDQSDLHPEADLTSLPMTIAPGPTAQDGTVTLHVMLTRGESVKGNPKQGMIGNYFERTVNLEVTE